MREKKPRKVQARTAVTRELLLAAAKLVFARVGYEKAQVEEIAEMAGFSKGALYAHFKSKEELFLGLYKEKTIADMAKLRAALKGAATREEKMEAFRRFYVDLSKDRDWALITLEVKLFHARHPALKERIQKIDEEIGDSIDDALVRLCGNGSRASVEALGGILPALVLEAAAEPEVFSERKMRLLLGLIFDSLIAIKGV